MELFAIKYGESLFPSEKIYHKDHLHTGLYFHWLFYVIKYENKIILVDTGFSDKQKIKEFEVNWVDPLYLLRKIKVEPWQVTDILVTHAHFDHFDNILHFDNANIIIQKDELKWYFEVDDPYIDEDVRQFLRKNHRIITFSNSYELSDTFVITAIKGHSIGSSVVSFTHLNKKYLLTGDEAYLPENIESIRPIGLNHDVEKNKAFLATLSKYDEVFTFHNPNIVGRDKDIKRIIP